MAFYSLYWLIPGVCTMAFGSLYWLAPKPILAALAASTKVNFFPRLWQQAFPQLLWLMTKNHAQTWLHGSSMED